MATQKEEDGNALDGDSDHNHNKAKPLSNLELLVKLGDDANNAGCVEVVQVVDKLAHVDHQGSKGVIESNWKCTLRDCGFERGEEGRKDTQTSLTSMVT